MASKPPTIKQEIPSSPLPPPPPPAPSNHAAMVIDLSSSDSDDSDQETHPNLPDKRPRVLNGEESTHATAKRKKPRIDSAALPTGFLVPLPRDNDPNMLSLPPLEIVTNPIAQKRASNTNQIMPVSGSKQFWKAGDYFDGSPDIGSSAQSSGIET